MKSIYLVAITLLLSTTLFSQTTSSPNVVGENFTLHSEVLKEDRIIQVSLPADYATTEMKYPVLYILDGQRFFLHGVSLHKSFVEFDNTPEFIVVGITNDESRRMGTFSANAENFSDFIGQEVIGFIDEQYRTTGERILFGWAYGGGFALESLMSNPQLFDSYILSSPYPVSSKINRIDSLLTHNDQLDNLVYFSSSDNEQNVKEGTEKLEQLLLGKSAATLTWNYRELVGETHRSTPYPTLYHGILDHFRHYTQLVIHSLDQFHELGGMPYVYDYYNKRSARYGLANEMSVFTKYNLARTAIRANDFTQFEFFMKEFGGNELVKELRVNWACTLAEFYLENKKYQQAKDMLLFIAAQYPDYTRPLNGLGDVHRALNEEGKAKAYDQMVADIKAKE
jgi:predicted alpha/beta superfamily hydrolase